MIKLISLVAVCALTCSGSFAEAEDLVGILKAQTANEHGAKFADGIMAASKKLEGVKFVMNDAENDVGKQISQAETMINDGAKVLAIEPASKDGAQVIAKMGKDHNVKVFTFNSRLADQNQVETFIGADNVAMGKDQMEFTAKKLNGKGNIVIIDGAMGHPAQIDRTDGYKAVLAKFPDIHVVREGSADWTSGKAVTLMENYLQSGEKIDAVVAQNDDEAKGASTAITDAGKSGQILISGIDGLSLGINMVAKGTTALTVEQGTQCQIDTIISVTKDLLASKTVQPEYICKANLITADNVAQWKK